MRKPLPKEEEPLRSPFIIEIVLFVLSISISIAVIFYVHQAMTTIKQYGDKINALTSELSKCEREIDDLEYELEHYKKFDNAKQSIISTQSIAPAAYSLRDGNVQTISSTRISKQKNWDPLNSEVQNVTGASKEQLTELVAYIIDKRWHIEDPNHPIMKSIDSLIQVEEDYNISAITQLSVLTWESGFCDIYESGEKKWPEKYRSCNNGMGIDTSDGPKYFESLDDCIMYFGKLIRDSYINEHGLETLTEIGDRYNGDRWTRCIRETTLEYNSKLEEIINLSSSQ